MNIRTRIAPSPTGYMHIGTARTALFNYLFAKKHHGQFLLRIEDTDAERSKPEYEKDIREGIQWLGLNWDGEIFRQSERRELYQKYARKLIESGEVYETEKAVILKKINKKITFKDLIRGEISFDFDEEIVLIKSDGMPTYHFAVVVDDHETDITHVIRGEDHISNTPKQILIQEALGFKRPEYAHVPLILAPDRSKLSKRHGAVSLNEFKAMGYLPQAMINFLALLGWHPETNQEIFSLGEFIKEFDLARVQKAGAVFDAVKLDSINNHYIKQMTPANIAERLKPHLANYNPPVEQLIKIAHLFQNRLRRFSEIKDLAEFVFNLPEYPPKLLTWKNALPEKTKDNLETALMVLEKMDENSFDIDYTTTEVMPLANKIGRGEVLWPLRVALTGLEKSPGPFEVMEVLGKQESLERIKKALDKL